MNDLAALRWTNSVAHSKIDDTRGNVETVLSSPCDEEMAAIDIIQAYSLDARSRLTSRARVVVSEKSIGQK